MNAERKNQLIKDQVKYITHMIEHLNKEFDNRDGDDFKVHNLFGQALGTLDVVKMHLMATQA
tara:strand:+ start:708 stop:893 length:186 start_codon:yes stop_codon:yes gene_type:complete